MSQIVGDGKVGVLFLWSRRHLAPRGGASQPEFAPGRARLGRKVAARVGAAKVVSGLISQLVS